MRYAMLKPSTGTIKQCVCVRTACLCVCVCLHVSMCLSSPLPSWTIRIFVCREPRGCRKKLLKILLKVLPPPLSPFPPSPVLYRFVAKEI